MIFKGYFNEWPLWYLVVIEKIWMDLKRAMAYDLDADEIVDINMTNKEDDPNLRYVNEYAIVGNKRVVNKLLKLLTSGETVPLPKSYKSPATPFKWPFWYEFALSMINPKYGTFVYLVDQDRVLQIQEEDDDGHGYHKITDHVWTKYKFTFDHVLSDQMVPIPSHIWSNIRERTLGDNIPILPEIIEVTLAEEPYPPGANIYIKNGKHGLKLISPLSDVDKIKIEIIRRDPRNLLCVLQPEDPEMEVKLFSISPSSGPIYSLILDNTGKYQNKNGDISYYIPWSLINIGQ